MDVFIYATWKNNLRLSAQRDKSQKDVVDKMLCSDSAQIESKVVNCSQVQGKKLQ